MATEYKLSYTGAEIDEKLGMIDTLSEEKVNHETRITALEAVEIPSNDKGNKAYEILEIVEASHKNLDTTPRISGSQNGVSWVVQEDGGIAFSGTSTDFVYVSPAYAYGDEALFALEAGTYVLSGSAQTVMYTCLIARLSDGTYEQFVDAGWGKVITLTEARQCNVQIVIKPDNNVDGLVVYSQLEKGETATDYENPNTKDTSRLDDLTFLIDKFQLDEPYVLTADRIEDGGLIDGTGEHGNDWHRIRTIDYIPMCAGGTVVCSAGQMNVWEYERETLSYLCDNNAWVTKGTPYVVQNDCCVRIMWSTDYTTPEQAAESTVFTGLYTSDELGALKPEAIPTNHIENIVNTMKNIKRWDNMPSMTVKTISHRGRYGANIGAMCGLSAMIAARRQGYQYVENDVMITADGKYVMWHDSNLQRLETLKDINGYLLYFDTNSLDYWYDETNSALYTYDYTNDEYVSSTVDINTLTQADQYTLSPKTMEYNVVRRLDFGASTGFSGEKVLNFAEWVLAAKELGMDLYVDFKNAITDEQAEELVNIVRRYGMSKNITWLSGWSNNNVAKIREVEPSARIVFTTNPTTDLINTYISFLENGEVIFNGQSTLLTAEAAQLALDNGFGLECWLVDFTNTLTEEEVFAEVERCVSLGVQRMTLDIYRVEDVFAAKYGL